MITLQTAEDAHAWGTQLAPTLAAGDVIALCGTLGAGKTQITRGIVAGMNSQAAVTSPTFTLVHEYLDGRLPVFHFDFYRMDSAAEVLGIGWDEFLTEPGIIIVEWADMFPDLLPPHTRWFQITPLPDASRTVIEQTNLL
ncbi:MAG: tRNA (adenosine(37)-N6)-threonylcarbamoyltransferase complex ATPase subunit type 1 TsaE [Prosthecobacter sp.]|uniref:tRNA (adenosine(37)-N6)-threonylcarbamoyltransferase complex ATPase subunit type 1 TsaE n=1 Tax=Prosthecobacter sp. TaxID=1965333 RepID=UPI00262F52B9|nr:tRNA (adenosine(37)-N6)-threonylcarbamoyltransferase complex ATPase subunit type 1 TsaE [Prosthecobacter sp.]MCF7789541.1 tRNA (adenosine(37)-N6)-threonylcarbamoyltransferase complex ATPase subunit type 1 TsaE [Prosthecobacter sp.]